MFLWEEKQRKSGSVSILDNLLAHLLTGHLPRLACSQYEDGAEFPDELPSQGPKICKWGLVKGFLPPSPFRGFPREVPWCTSVPYC